MRPASIAISHTPPCPTFPYHSPQITEAQSAATAPENARQAATRPYSDRCADKSASATSLRTLSPGIPSRGHFLQDQYESRRRSKAQHTFALLVLSGHPESALPPVSGPPPRNFAPTPRVSTGSRQTASRPSHPQQ